MCPQEPCKIIFILILQRIVHLVCAKDLEFEAVFSGIALFSQPVVASLPDSDASGCNVIC